MVDLTQITSKGTEAINKAIPFVDKIAVYLQPLIKPAFSHPIGSLIITLFVVFLIYKAFHHTLSFFKAAGLGLIILVIIRALTI